MPSIRLDDPVYLDNNATTFLHPEVADVMGTYLRGRLGNAASQHALGRQARAVIEDARDGIAEILGAAAGDQLIFTSGGTEANNLAVQGLAGDQPGSLVVSSIEHPSVGLAGEALQRRGFRCRQLPARADGQVELERLADLLTDDTRLVCVMLGNNETGVLQPVEQVVAFCGKRGIPVHSDAVQAVGKIPVCFSELGVATLSLTAHKFHGPRGIGALLVRRGVRLEPLLHGGFQQAGLRPGTEPIELVAGLFAALQLWQRETDERTLGMTGLRDRFEQELRAEAPELVVLGSESPRLPHTSNIAFPGIDRQTLVMALDLAGIACSTGSACASGSSEPSPVLLAMGLPSELVDSALRFSFGALTTNADVDLSVRCILSVYRDLQHRHAGRKPAPSSRTAVSDPI